MLEDRRRWLDPEHPHLTVQQQCELLGVPRSTYYYQPRPESAENLRLLRRLDELYLERPFFGSRRMDIGLEVNRKRTQQLMRLLTLAVKAPAEPFAYGVCHGRPLSSAKTLLRTESVT